MEYKVVAKDGLKIPFRFLREGNVFDSSKTPLSQGIIKNFLAEGKIEYTDTEMQTKFLDKLKAVAKEAEAKLKAKSEAEAKTDKTKK